MSVALSTPPPALSFSADQIVAQFTSLGYLQTAGVASVNTISFYNAPAVGHSMNIKFGSYNLTFIAALSPDDSGTQYSAFASGTDVNLATGIIAEDLKHNPYLSEFYKIEAEGNSIKFTTKKKGLGFDFSGDGANTTTGVAELVKPNYSIYFKLFIENENYDGFDQIYETNLQLINGFAGVSEIQLGDKLHSAIEGTLRKNFPDQPISNYVECKKSCRRYYFEFAERYGATVQLKKLHKSDYYKVLHGGLSTRAQFNTTLLNLIAPSTIDKDRFLKQGATHIYTRTNQPQYLYFYNTRSTKNGAILKANVEYADGEIATVDLETLNLTEASKFAFNVTYDNIKSKLANKQLTKYSVYLSHNSSQISEERAYYLDYSDKSYIRYFINWSSFGGYDTRVCFGEGESEFELTSKSAERVRRKGDDIKHGNRLTYGSKLTRSFGVNTGWLSKRDLQLNADFFLSDYKYRYTGGLMLPIEIAPGKISEITDGDNLYTQKISYKYLIDDHAYTEGDAEDNGEVISGFFFNTPSVVFNPSGFTETDPTVPAWVKTITLADINRWNSAANPTDLNNFYNRDEIAAILSGNPSLPGYNKAAWDIVAAKTNLSHFINDLGNYGNWITQGTADTRYQPLEDQRLGTNDKVVFRSLIADKAFSIPSEEIPTAEMDDGRTYLFGAPVPSTPPLVHVVARMGDLLNFSEAGRQDGYIVYWDEATAMYRLKENTGGVNPGDLTNYYTKSEIGGILGGGIPISGYNKANWDSAYASSHTHANKAFLDTLVSGATVNLNISGSAATASNSNLWNGNVYVGSDVAVNTYLMAYGSDGAWHPTNANHVKSFLGLGSLAYLNGLSGAQVNTDISIPDNDIGIAKLMRWKNYGSGHVIFDASNGTAPNGTVIDSTNPQVNWAASYPTLMGWNGANTFGVRVDRAADAERWGGQPANFGVEKTNLTSIGAFGVGDGMGYAYAPAVRTFLGLPSDSNTIHRSIGFAGGYPGANANTVPENTTSFSYANNAPYNGALVHLGNGGYGLQFSSSYGSTSPELSFRSRNGDAGHWNDWKAILFSGYDKTATFSGGSGTGYTTANVELFRNGSGAGAPNISFHWGGVVASSISIQGSGRIAILNNPGTAYEDFVANVITAANRVCAGYDSGVAGSVNGLLGFFSTSIQAPSIKATTKLVIPTVEPSVAEGEVALYWGGVA